MRDHLSVLLDEVEDADAAAIVLRVEAPNRVVVRELTLSPGIPVAPFTVGAARIAYNGRVLFVSAVTPDARVRLDGMPLLARWTEARVPCEVRFRTGRICVFRRDREDEAPTTRDTPRRVPLEEHATCIDDERLRAALRRSVAQE